MTTKTLARHYDALALHERFAARYAASLRGDEAEVARLEQGAPRATFRMGEVGLFGHAVLAVEHEYLAGQMDLALLLHQLLLAWEAARKEAKDSTYADDPIRLFHAAKFTSFKMLALRTAFLRLMGRLKIDPAPCLALLTGAEAVADALERAEALAFTAEEARVVRLCPTGRPTAFEDDRRAELWLHAVFNYWLKLWGLADPLAETMAKLRSEVEAQAAGGGSSAGVSASVVG